VHDEEIVTLFDEPEKTAAMRYQRAIYSHYCRDWHSLLNMYT